MMLNHGAIILQERKSLDKRKKSVELREEKLMLNARSAGSNANKERGEYDNRRS